MKCPFKLLKAPYDGGAKCDEECAWLVDRMDWNDEKEHYEHRRVCAVALMAANRGYPRGFDG